MQHSLPFSCFRNRREAWSIRAPAGLTRPSYKDACTGLETLASGSLDVARCGDLAGDFAKTCLKQSRLALSRRTLLLKPMHIRGHTVMSCYKQHAQLDQPYKAQRRLTSTSSREQPRNLQVSRQNRSPVAEGWLDGSVIGTRDQACSTRHAWDAHYPEPE